MRGVECVGHRHTVVTCMYEGVAFIRGVACMGRGHRHV